jgi:cystathionine beta-synthase
MNPPNKPRNKRGRRRGRGEPRAHPHAQTQAQPHPHRPRETAKPPRGPAPGGPRPAPSGLRSAALPAVGDVLALIGNTPLLEVRGLDTGRCRLFLKLENQNPGGSIKDRIGLSMIEAAERDRKIRPGGTLIEATAGNTGLGLALVAARKGYRLLLVIPDKMSQEKVFHLKAMGTEVVMARSDVGKGHPEYYQDVAARLARETPNSFYVNQFANPANPDAHEDTTGPEIWEQMGHQVDAVVCGVGTGGTLTGLSRFFARVSPDTEMVLADPVGSILAEYVKTGEVPREVGTWLVEGIGEDFIPPVCDLAHVHKAYSIPDGEAFRTCRELLRQEGILAGSSSGTLIAAALRYCREQPAPKRVVSFVCDSGNKYLSKVYNDYWMIDQGFLERERFGDLRDLIARRHREHAVVTVGADETVLAAYRRMKLYDVSQLPVMRDGRIVGIVDEEDILIKVADQPEHFREPVTAAMASRLVTVPPDAPIARLIEIFKQGMVAIVMDGDEFLGLITRSDLLNWLRRRIQG